MQLSIIIFLASSTVEPISIDKLMMVNVSLSSAANFLKHLRFDADGGELTSSRRSITTLCILLDGSLADAVTSDLSSTAGVADNLFRYHRFFC